MKGAATDSSYEPITKPPTGVIRKVFSWLSVVALLVPLISGVYVLYEGYQESITKPLVGLTIGFSKPAGANSIFPQGITVRQYEMYNPGPKSLAPHQLRATVKFKFKDKESPPDGLCPDSVVGLEKIDYESDQQGAWTLVKVTPWHTGEPASVAPGQRFGVRFVVPQEDWKPEQVRLSGPGLVDVDASGPMILPAKESYSLVLYIISIALIMVGLGAPVVISLLLRRHLPRLAREEAKKAEGRIRAQADEKIARLREGMQQLEMKLKAPTCKALPKSAPKRDNGPNAG